MILGTIAWLTGIVCLQYLPNLPDRAWLWSFPLLVALALRCPRVRLLAIAGAGFIWALGFAGELLAHGLPPQLQGRDLEVRGYIASIPEVDAHHARFQFVVQQWPRHGTVPPMPWRVRLGWYGAVPRLGVGQRWQLTVRLKRPHGFRNPGGFDYEGWLFRRGIEATGYVRRKESNRRLHGPPEGNPVDRFRQYLAGRIDNVRGDSPRASLLTALTVGARGGISQDQWRVLRTTGTSHLVAISGLHIGLVAGLLFAAVRWLWLRIPTLAFRVAAPRAGALAGLAGALGYAALAGFSLSTQRALIMVAVAMGALYLQRPPRVVRTLALALLLVTLWDPLSVLGPGLWLSFGAVAAILWVCGARVGKGPWWWRWGRVQWAVAVGLAPLLLMVFGQLPLLGVAANLVAVPLIGFVVVPLALAGTVLLVLPWTAPANLLLAGADLALRILWLPLQWLSHLSWALWTPGVAPLWTLPLAVVGLAVLLAPAGLPSRWVGLILLGPLLFRPAQPPPANGTFVFTLLDVGQGEAAVVRTRRHLLLFDAGPRFSPSFDAGSAVVVPYLRALGLNRVDGLVVSHGDADHAGGLASVRQSVFVARQWSAAKAIPGVPCRAGQHWEWDGVRFEMLNPDGASGATRNDNSCVLRVAAGSHSLLLTADIERAAERRLVAHYGAQLAAGILVVPHHGSASSSTPQFVAAVHPRYALVSAGYRNRFGFPNPAVVHRYRAHGARVLQTARSGAISFVVSADAGLSRPQRFRSATLRYWQWR